MPTPEPLPEPARVRIVDVQIPFGSMVSLLVTVSLAAIPALLLLTFIGFVVFSLLLNVVH